MHMPIAGSVEPLQHSLRGSREETRSLRRRRQLRAAHHTPAIDVRPFAASAEHLLVVHCKVAKFSCGPEPWCRASISTCRSLAAVACRAVLRRPAECDVLLHDNFGLQHATSAFLCSEHAKARLSAAVTSLPHVLPSSRTLEYIMILC